MKYRVVLYIGLLAVAAGCSRRGTVEVGGACSVDEACFTSVCIREAKDVTSNTWVGGYCSGNCGGPTQCPQGLCLLLADGHSYCASECQSENDCRNGYVCSTAVHACLPDCRLGWSCGALLNCDQFSGICTVPGSIQANTPLGGSCSLNAQCLSGLCIPEQKYNTGLGWQGGSCSLDCTKASCPSGAVCAKLEDGNAYCAVACSATSPCRAGYVCSPTLNACLPDCRQGWSCGSTLTCDTNIGFCGVPTKPPAPVGSSCTLNAECLGDLCIPYASSTSATGWSDGYCTQDCATSTCPSNTACFRFQDDNSRCLAGCSASTPCRAGYLCSPTLNVCLPDCRQGWSCGTGFTCDTATGACGPTMSPPAPLGSPCAWNAECLSNLCIPEGGDSSITGWKNGYCTQDCATTACPTGTTCLAFQDGNSRCLASCSAANPCRSGYACSPTLNACLPDCRQGWSCGTGLTCDSATGACGVPSKPPAPVGSTCTLNAECQGSLCIPANTSTGTTGWTGGYCTQNCATAACPTGTTCWAFQDGNSRCLASCSAAKPCRSGYACSPTLNACLPDCRQGWSCGTGLTCDSATGACGVPTKPPTPVGTTCTLNAECQGSLCIPANTSTGATGWTGGYCTQNCATTACPTGTTCLAFQDGNSRCLANCSASTPCRSGYVCDTDVVGCLPDCRLGWSCGTILTCNASTGMCMTKPLPDAGVKTDSAVPSTVPDASGTPGPGPGGAGGGGPGPGGPGGRL